MPNVVMLSVVAPVKIYQLVVMPIILISHEYDTLKKCIQKCPYLT
jgi:hypothetical protein